MGYKRLFTVFYHTVYAGEVPARIEAVAVCAVVGVSIGIYPGRAEADELFADGGLSLREQKPAVLVQREGLCPVHGDAACTVKVIVYYVAGGQKFTGVIVISEGAAILGKPHYRGKPITKGLFLADQNGIIPPLVEALQGCRTAGQSAFLGAGQGLPVNLEGRVKRGRLGVAFHDGLYAVVAVRQASVAERPVHGNGPGVRGVGAGLGKAHGTKGQNFSAGKAWYLLPICAVPALQGGIGNGDRVGALAEPLFNLQCQCAAGGGAFGYVGRNAPVRVFQGGGGSGRGKGFRILSAALHQCGLRVFLLFYGVCSQAHCHKGNGQHAQ